MKRPAYFVLSLLLCALARQGLCANAEGTAAASFLKLPVDARSAGLGEAVAGDAHGAMALFQNPAGLAANKTAAFGYGHAALLEEISYDVLGAAVPAGRAGVVGAGAQYLKYGSFASLDNTGAAAGSLSPRDSAVALGYGLDLADGFLAGVTVKSLNSKISGSASTSVLDLGLLLNDDVVSMGFTAQNMGKGLKFNKEASPLPVNLKFGVSVRYLEDWQWVADFNFPKDGPAWVAAGAEYAFKFNEAWALLGRAGYNTAAADTKGLNGLALGFGLARENLSFDYAFRTLGLLGGTHHLGLTYRLGD